MERSTRQIGADSFLCLQDILQLRDGHGNSLAFSSRAEHTTLLLRVILYKGVRGQEPIWPGMLRGGEPFRMRFSLKKESSARAKPGLRRSR